MASRVGQTKYRYITVIRHPYPGYEVVIPHPENVGERVRKGFFGVAKPQVEYLHDAIAWRDQTYFALYKHAIRSRLFHRQQANSTTNKPGVRKMEKIVKKKHKDGTTKEYRIPCILAEIYTIPGKNHKPTSGSRSKVYSIAKYGEEEAIRLAVEWRKNMEEILAEDE